MSAAIASRRSPSRMASAMKGSSSTINTRTLTPWYGPEHIVDVSKNRYVLATRRGVDLGRDPQPTSTGSSRTRSTIPIACISAVAGRGHRLGLGGRGLRKRLEVTDGPQCRGGPDD